MISFALLISLVVQVCFGCFKANLNNGFTNRNDVQGGRQVLIKVKTQFMVVKL